MSFAEQGLYVPLRIHYHFKRWLFSTGNNIALGLVKHHVTSYSNNTTIRNASSDNMNLDIYFQETVAYRLFKNKGIYATLSAEQMAILIKRMDTITG